MKAAEEQLNGKLDDLRKRQLDEKRLVEQLRRALEEEEQVLNKQKQEYAMLHAEHSKGKKSSKELAMNLPMIKKMTSSMSRSDPK